MDILKLFDWQSLLIASAITTFAVSAINTIQTKLSTNWLVFVIALVVTVLSTEIVGIKGIENWQKVLVQIILTMSFSVLFYNYLGKLFLDDIFGWIKKKIGESTGTTAPPVNPPIQPGQILVSEKSMENVNDSLKTAVENMDNKTKPEAKLVQ